MDETMRVETQLLAEELYRLILALAPRRMGGDPGVAQLRLQAAGERLRSLRAVGGEAPAGVHGRLQRHLGELEQVLAENGAALEPGARWRAFRRRLSPAYQSFAAFLREQRIVVPSLRPSNVPRVAFHVGSGVFAFALIQLLSPTMLRVAAVTFALTALSLEGARRLWPAWNALLMKAFGSVAHPHEHHRVNSATWYAMALAILALLVPPLIAGLAVAVLAVGDPVAGIVGRRFGRTPLRAGRSLEGTLAFVLSGTLVAAAVLAGFSPGLGWGMVAGLALTAGLSGALAELWTQHFDDNFMIPLVVGAATSLFSTLILP